MVLRVRPVALLAMPLTVAALAYTPMDRRDHMWDTWIFRDPHGGWILNYLMQHNNSHRWNAVATALSSNGVHWADVNTAIIKDCVAPDDCAVWLGSGSIWKRPVNGSSEYVMNYSEQYDCVGSNCQSIFFATSTDLVNWRPLAPDAQAKGGPVFKYNDSFYQTGGRWDCIAVLPRPGGGLLGYWTATPHPATKGAPNYCGDTASCGAGFGESDDGVTWRALPSPGPPVHGEVGGLAQVGAKTYMVFDGGRLFEAASPYGPFVAAKNYNFLTDAGHAVFPRLWGSLYTGDANLTLISHQQVVSGPWPRQVIYAGLIKRAVLGPDGVLRACWWEANDVLKGNPLQTIRQVPAAFGDTQNVTKLSTVCTGDCLTSGLWLEGIVGRVAGVSGLWLETSTGGFGLAINTSASNTFLLGSMHTPGVWDWPPLQVDRQLADLLDARTEGVRWCAVARNSWSNVGMVEFYVAGILSLPFTLNGSLTGTFALLNASVTGVHTLSLPAQNPITDAASTELFSLPPAHLVGSHRKGGHVGNPPHQELA